MFTIAAALFLAGCGEVDNNGSSAPQNTEEVGDGLFTDNGNGTVSFSYNNTGDKRCKVVIRLNEGKMYQYDIPSGQCDLVFPLSQGNGRYQVMLCRNTTGSKYMIVGAKTIELKTDDALSVFLTSNYIINWNTENEAIKKAYELTKGLKDDKDKIEAIYEYMVKNFSYDYEKMESVKEESTDKAYVPSIDDTYATKNGICYDLSALTASMLRSVSIPAKVVTGYTGNTVSYHAWNSIYYSPVKDWKTVDITYDILMFRDGKRYSMFKKDEYYSDVYYQY